LSVRREQRRDPKTGVSRDFWYVDVDFQLPNGQRKRVRKVSPVQSRRGAEQYERDLRATILSGEFKAKEVPVPTLSEFSEEYLTMHTKVHNKRSGLVNAQHSLRLHILPAMGALRLDQIDEYVIAKFRAAQKEKDLKPASINNHLILLRAILGKAHEWKRISAIPKVKKLPNPLPPIRYLSFEEAARLESAARSDTSWSAAIIVALNTGMRLGELIALQWDDIDLVSRILTVQRSDWQGTIGTPKSGKQRNIPLNDKVIAALKAHRHLRGPWVFCRDDGSRRSNGEFALALRRIRKLSGLQGFEWHGLRHTFASHLAMRNVPMRAIQELLGHADMQMTLRYSHLSPATSRRAVESLLDSSPEELRQPDGNRGWDDSATQREAAPVCSTGAGTSFGSGGRI
jgi:integrase